MNLRPASSSGGAVVSSFQKVRMLKKPKKRKNLRQELARKKYSKKHVLDLERTMWRDTERECTSLEEQEE